MRAKRATTYQCCYICGQWGFGRAAYRGVSLCVDCEADVMRQQSILGRTTPWAHPPLRPVDPRQLPLDL